VKGFLISKLHETELALKNTMTSSTEALRQFASDQEVISYLDRRVQELELDLEDSVREKKSIRAMLELEMENNREVTAGLERRCIFVEDEKERVEGELRQVKKVLVREVKTLRLQLAKAQTERDRLQIAVDQFKSALHIVT